MDTKRLIIGMVLAMAIVVGWQAMVGWIYEANNWAIPTTQPATPEIAPAPPAPPAPPAVSPTATQTPPDTYPNVTVPAPQAADLRVANTAEAERTELLGSATPNDPQFTLALRTTNDGAAVSSVVLNQFLREVRNAALYEVPGTLPDAPDVTALGTRSVTIDGQAVSLIDRKWTLVGATQTSATYSVDVVGPDGPLVRVIKTFFVSPVTPDEYPRRGYEVIVRQQMQNLSGRALTVATSINGPVPPVRENDQTDDRQIIAGYLAQNAVAVQAFLLSEFDAETQSRNLLVDEDNQRLLWAGASSVYFNAIVRPDPLVNTELVPQYLSDVTAWAVNPQAEASLRQVAMVFNTNALELPAGATTTLNFRAFFGPKKREILKNEYYSSLPFGYDKTLATNLSGCATFCTWPWLIDGLVKLLGFFHMVFRDWGLAIIGLVVVVRLLLHPITKRSTISMAKMGKMGPEMERLRKKYGDNKDELNKAMMQMYKEQGFTPILGCLPMFLQMPIWIALWSALQNTFELRHAPFLEFFGINFTWIRDLGHPDRLIHFPAQGIDLWLLKIDALNVLPLLLAVVFFLQQKYTPKPPATTPEQEQQQKMMQWMTLLFPLFLYNAPSGLNLYILTSTTWGIIESKRIRDHIQEREEAEKAGKIVVEARPTRGQKRGGGEKAGPSAAPKGGIGGWLANLQAKAEELRKQAEQGRRK